VCGRSCECPSRYIWQRMSDGLKAIVDSITLEDMINNNHPEGA